MKALTAAGLVAAAVVPAIALGAAGDFGQPATSPESAGHTGHGIVSGDFNEDLEDDLAIANSGSNDVTILLGDGTGNFTAAPSSPEAVPGASDVAAGDLDNDGDEDLAVAGTEVYSLLNDGLGTGNFAAPLTENLDDTAVSGTASSIGIAQMNGDTDLDVVAGQSYHPRVTVLINDGDDDGDFTALPFEVASDVAPGSDTLANIALAPIDNTFNSVADVMVARPSTGTVHTMANANGAGDLAFQSTQFTVGGGGAADVTLGQFGSNAFNDVAIANPQTNTVTILIGAGDGGFTEAGTSPEAVPGGGTDDGPRAITAGEFNGDANLDLAMGAGYNNANSRRVVVMLGNGAGDFSPTAGSPIDVGTNLPNGIATGDFNGGNLDLAVTNFYPLPNSAVNILLNDFTPPTTGGGGGGTTTTPITGTTPPVTTPPVKKCKKGQKLKKGKCVKKKAKKK